MEKELKLGARMEPRRCFYSWARALKNINARTMERKTKFNSRNEMELEKKPSFSPSHYAVDFFPLYIERRPLAFPVHISTPFIIRFLGRSVNDLSRSFKNL